MQLKSFAPGPYDESHTSGGGVILYESEDKTDLKFTSICKSPSVKYEIESLEGGAWVVPPKLKSIMASDVISGTST